MGQLADAIEGEFVLVVDPIDPEQGTLYAHSEFLGAFQHALLKRVDSMIPNGATSRSVSKALAMLRTKEAHKATLADAITRLRRCGNPVGPDELTSPNQVVAVFRGT